MTGAALLYPEPHYYQLFCYIYQARNSVSNQILTFQGRKDPCHSSLVPSLGVGDWQCGHLTA